MLKKRYGICKIVPPPKSWPLKKSGNCMATTKASAFFYPKVQEISCLSIRGAYFDTKKKIVTEKIRKHDKSSSNRKVKTMIDTATTDHFGFDHLVHGFSEAAFKYYLFIIIYK